ncbi:hypothetical protein KV097_06310 [Mumia sp. zg.B17]|uniref:hypothetical protein n=1 Tax=Mumia sp. zg.B17 TaxID=2855446 RepID=UPI001C6F033E|nr:hypothetical protein [Mumia sp. zg.B17]MBW9205556.1 hypothetical protein [Mumia sp. zg.B17]
MRARTRLDALARVAGAVALMGGSLALVSSPAAAAEGTPAAGTVAFSCTMPDFKKDFDYAAKVSVAGYRAAEGGPVTLRATLSDLPGVAPVAINNASMSATLKLTIDGQAVTLKGTGPTTAAPNGPVPVTDVSGTVTSSKAELPVTATAFTFVVSGVGGQCTASTALSVLTVSDEPPPTPTTPTPTPKPTKAPTTAPAKAPTSAPPAGNPGKPAKGTVKFACVMSIGSKFDYNATISVSGYRKNAGDPVSLQATMSKLPGIAPVPIDGSMEYTLNLSVGGTATTLTATDTVNAAPKAVVPVPTLKGSVKASGDELDVKASGFSFDFPSASIGAKCTGSGTLSKMTVSSEPPADSDGGGSGGGSSDPAATLPKTGGTGSLPVIGLVAASLVFLGAAGLVWLPSRRGTATRG